MRQDDSAFFIGWAGPKGALRDLMLGVAVGLVFLMCGLGLFLATTQDDPGAGRFAGGAEATGVLTAAPYPVLHVESSETFATGTPLLLSGLGKRGVQDRAGPLDGQLVRLRGVRLERGEHAGLQVGGAADAFAAVEDVAAVQMPAPRDLGRWRLTGEICDGKCLNGAMRPGRGLAHKACANLCLIGGAPPLFVTTAPVDGASILLLGDTEGGPVTEAILDHTARLVAVEGRVERRGDLHVFLIDPDTLEFQ